MASHTAISSPEKLLIHEALFHVLQQMMTAAAGNASKARRQQPEETRTAIVVSICGAALAGLTVMAKRCRGERSAQILKANPLLMSASAVLPWKA